MDDQAVAIPLLNVKIDYADRINFAFQQNSIPILRKIHIENRSDSDLQNLSCRFVSTPEWADSFEEYIDQIPAGGSFSLADVPVELNFEFVAGLSDRVRGDFRIEIRVDGEEESKRQVVFSKRFSVDVYAFDEWTGLQGLPAILAAFVTPNVA